MNITWNAKNMRRMINEGRVNDGQTPNPVLAHNIIVKGIRQLAEFTHCGRDGEGFASSSVPAKVRVAVYHARNNGRLYGRPFFAAKGYCLKHAKQLAKWANEKK